MSLSLLVLLALAQTPQTPEQFFGFPIGTDHELARYPDVLQYMQHLADVSDRMTYRVLGKTTMGNDYALCTFSSPSNLARLDRLTEITNRLANPRGLDPADAKAMIEEGRPFYFLYATIHSTEIGNGQAIIEIAHEMATSSASKVQEILDDAVLLMVPSQNPDGQVLVIDHYYNNRGTANSTGYPDLYHKYTGHDDNRDWFMFTQKETLLNIEKVQNTYRPQITHDMHQMGNTGFRIFTPPFVDPYDRNIHPILSQGQAQVGMAMASALIAEGKSGVGFHQRFDLWTPARQYMVYHGQPRILTEIASAHFAAPQISQDGSPLGPQEPRWNFPRPYTGTEWHLRDIVDYGKIAVFAGLTHVAKYHETWLENFYKVHRDWVTRQGPPHAFVVSADQRDPFETYELLRILEIGDVEIHRATQPFAAGGRDYPADSWVVKLDQPYGAFAKTMLEVQEYPDLRAFPGGPPLTPYDVTAHTLGYLLGVDVDRIDEPFEAELIRIAAVEPRRAPPIDNGGSALVFGPESNAGFKAAARLQADGIPLVRAAEAFELDGRRHAPGTWIAPVSARSALAAVSNETGLVVRSVSEVPAVAAHRLALPTRVGLWKGANNMPAGWMKWLFEQYGFDHRTVSSHDFAGALSDKYDVIVLPAGTSKRTIQRGLDRRMHGKEWSWAYGVGARGWEALRLWVRDGGTIVALGNSVETVREMFDLPIVPALPQNPRGRGPAVAAAAPVAANLRDTFQSPASLLRTLEQDVVTGRARFYCPGGLLNNRFDTTHPVAYGMPPVAPVFFRNDQAYALKPGFGRAGQVVSSYPGEGEIRASGWLLGGELLRDRANAMAFEVGRGTVVAIASQAAFRTQTRATFKLLFNAMFHGPSTPVPAAGVADALRR